MNNICKEIKALTFKECSIVLLALFILAPISIFLLAIFLIISIKHYSLDKKLIWLENQKHYIQASFITLISALCFFIDKRDNLLLILIPTIIFYAYIYFKNKNT